MDTWHTCASLTFTSFATSDGYWCRSGLWKEYLLACIAPHNSHTVVLIFLTSSTIIQEVLHICRIGLAVLAFFYFDHRDVTKLDARGFLTSLLVQFCDQSDSFYDVFSILYQEHDRGTRQPEEGALMECLINMIRLSGQPGIYIIVDALDECPNSYGSPSAREQVLGVLQELIDLGHPNLHLCVASRPEIDIQRVLERKAAYSVTLQDEYGQNHDVANYVYSVVHSDPAMQRWPEEEKLFITDSLIRSSNGMYAIVIFFCLRHFLMS